MGDFIEPLVQGAANLFPSLFEAGTSAAPALAEGASAVADSAPGWFPASAETLANAAPTAISVGGDIAGGAAPGLIGAADAGAGALGGLGSFASGAKGAGSSLFSSPAEAATPTTPGEGAPNDVVSNAFASLDTGVDGTTGFATSGMGGGSTTPTATTMPGGFASAAAPAGAGPSAPGESLDDLLLKNQKTPQAGAAQPASLSSPTTTAATPTGATPKADGSGGFLGDLVSGAKNQVTKNPLGLALGAAGLGYNMFQSKANAPPAAGPALAANNATAQQQAGVGAAATGTGVSNLTTAAATQAGQGNPLIASGSDLTKYLGTDVLPAPQQAALDQATNAAKARAISNAAAQGQPTDPTKNTALAMTLTAIDNNALAMKGQMQKDLASGGQGLITTGAGLTGQSAADSTSLLNGGLSASGLSSKIYDALVAQDNKQSADIGKAIANFAAAINPGGSKVAA